MVDFNNLVIGWLYKRMSASSCPICLCGFGDDTVLGVCGHAYHSKCMS
jgi:hypothetical protein